MHSDAPICIAYLVVERAALSDGREDAAFKHAAE